MGTTAIERLERHKRTFSNNVGESTVSSPASMWNSQGSNCFKFGSNSSQSASSRSFSSNTTNPWNSNNQTLFSGLNSERTSLSSDRKVSIASTSSSRFSMHSSYENDRLMQMD